MINTLENGMDENKQYKDLVFDRSGYTGAARAEVEAYDRALIRELKRCGAKESPVLWNYACAVNSALMVVKHIEGMLFGVRPEEKPVVNAEPKKDRDIALIETMGKAAERWRIAVKDLENYLVKTGAPAQIALADVMKPILKRAEGVLEDALAFEAARQKKRKNSDKDE